MWWLVIPVIIYSAGLLILWFISVSRSESAGRTEGGFPEGNDPRTVQVMPGLSAMSEVLSASGNAGLPKITVVVAARNEEKRIVMLLRCLAIQDYPGDLLEIIIVNDDSSDRTPIVVSNFIETCKDPAGPRIRLIFNPFPGKKRAIRYGIEKASGEVIITTDADCTVGPEWVSSHASWYKGGGAGLAGSGMTGHSGSEPVMTGNSSIGIAGSEPVMTGNSSIGIAGSEPVMTGNSSIGYAGREERQAPSQDDTNETGETAMVLARVFQKPAGGFWSLFGIFEFSALQALTESTAVAGHPVMCNAANMSFRREVYMRHSDQLRPDLASGDDMFLLHAVKRDGGTVRHDGCAAAAAETAAAVTAAALLRQRARWASKTFHYRDAATLTLAAATAACNAAVAAAAVASFISVNFIPTALTFYAVKAVPDMLLVAHEMRKENIRLPVLPFIISELIYPFYFMTVAVASRIPFFSRFGNGR